MDGLAPIMDSEAFIAAGRPQLEVILQLRRGDLAIWFVVEIIGNVHLWPCMGGQPTNPWTLTKFLTNLSRGLACPAAEWNLWLPFIYHVPMLSQAWFMLTTGMSDDLLTIGPTASKLVVGYVLHETGRYRRVYWTWSIGGRMTWHAVSTAIPCLSS